jgi:hypothetical protein
MLMLSNSEGTTSTRYSTTASGPLSTCKPWGIAYDFMPGLSLSAIARISVASSAVHMDAEKITPGWYCRTVGATSLIASGRSAS